MDNKENSALFVDDDNQLDYLVRKSFLSTFSDYSYAKTGKQALEMIEQRETPYNVMLCDYHLPDITGTDLLKVLNTSPKRPLYPISFSGDNRIQVLQESIESGYFGNFPKDINLNSENMKSKWNSLIERMEYFEKKNNEPTNNKENNLFILTGAKCRGKTEIQQFVPRYVNNISIASKLTTRNARSGELEEGRFLDTVPNWDDIRYPLSEDQGIHWNSHNYSLCIPKINVDMHYPCKGIDDILESKSDCLVGDGSPDILKRLLESYKNAKVIFLDMDEELAMELYTSRQMKGEKVSLESVEKQRLQLEDSLNKFIDSRYILYFKNDDFFNTAYEISKTIWDFRK